MNLKFGFPIASTFALITWIATLFAKEFISKLKVRYTKLRDWIIVISVFYEKRLKKSMADQKIDDEEAQNLKKKFIIITLLKEMIL